MIDFLDQLSFAIATALMFVGLAVVGLIAYLVVTHR